MKRYVEKLSSMPDFFQADRAYGPLPRNGNAYCGPTAAANALVWLDTNGFGNLLPAARPGPKEQLELIRLLGTVEYMKTDPVNGSGPSQIMDGVKRYCFERGYRTLIEHAGWRTRSYRVADKPAIGWMLQRVEGTSSLVVNIGWYKAEEDGKTCTRTGGHYVTVVGYERGGGETWLYVHDPAKRSRKAKRTSTERWPVKCQLRPLPADAALRKKAGGDTFPGEGLLILDGIPLKKGADRAIIDGAIAFAVVP